MARLTEADAEHLVEALRTGSGLQPAEHPRDAVYDHKESVRRVQVFLSDAARCDALGRSMTLDLASYLRRPVRCSVSVPGQVFSNSWRFEGTTPGLTWWLELDVDLACAFADAMIGGDGTARLSQGRRVRGLAARIALRMMQHVAASAEVDAPPSAAFVSVSTVRDSALAGGLCAVATDQYGWQVGVSPLAAEERVREKLQLAPAIVTRPTPSGEAAVTLQSLVDAVCEHLRETLHANVSASAPVVTVLTGPELHSFPPAALRLGLTAGGNGAFVASLDREAVAGLAGGAAAVTVPSSGSPGDVVVAAAESMVLDALREVAGRLPGIAGELHRIVRLDDNSLPARTPHHAVDVRINVGGKAGTLRLLVPSWMLGPR